MSPRPKQGLFTSVLPGNRARATKHDPRQPEPSRVSPPPSIATLDPANQITSSQPESMPGSPTAKNPTDSTTSKASGPGSWRCQMCGSEATCRKRTHPTYGPSTLCNACGVWIIRKSGSLQAAATNPEQLPSRSPAAAREEAKEEATTQAHSKSPQAAATCSPSHPTCGMLPSAGHLFLSSPSPPLRGGTLPPLCAGHSSSPSKTSSRWRRPSSKGAGAAARALLGECKPMSKSSIVLECARCGLTRTPMKRHHHSYGSADLCNACGVHLRRLDDRDKRSRTVVVTGPSGEPSCPSSAANSLEHMGLHRSRRPCLGRPRLCSTPGHSGGPGAGASYSQAPSEAAVAEAQRTVDAAAKGEREAAVQKRRRLCLDDALRPLQTLPDSELQRRFDCAVQRAEALMDSDNPPTVRSSPQVHGSFLQSQIGEFVQQHAMWALNERMAVTRDGRDVCGRVTDATAYRRMYGFLPTAFAAMTHEERVRVLALPQPPGKKERLRQLRQARRAATALARAHLTLKRAHQQSGNAGVSSSSQQGARTAAAALDELKQETGSCVSPPVVTMSNAAAKGTPSAHSSEGCLPELYPHSSAPRVGGTGPGDTHDETEGDKGSGDAWEATHVAQVQGHGTGAKHKPAGPRGARGTAAHVMARALGSGLEAMGSNSPGEAKVALGQEGGGAGVKRAASALSSKAARRHNSQAKHCASSAATNGSGPCEGAAGGKAARVTASARSAVRDAGGKKSNTGRKWPRPCGLCGLRVHTANDGFCGYDIWTVGPSCMPPNLPFAWSAASFDL
jgi:hypothetical protein